MGDVTLFRRGLLVLFVLLMAVPLLAAPASRAQETPDPAPIQVQPDCVAADDAACGNAVEIPDPVCPAPQIYDPSIGGCLRPEGEEPPAEQGPADGDEGAADGAEDGDGSGEDGDGSGEDGDGSGDAVDGADAQGEGADGAEGADPEGEDGDEAETAPEPTPTPEPVRCAADERRTEANTCRPVCPSGFRLEGDGTCSEILNPSHPCVVAGRVPSGVVSNAVLNGYAYLSGTRECVTHAEFQRRVSNFEAAAGNEKSALDSLNSLTTEVLALEQDLADLEARLAAARSLVRDAKAGVVEAAGDLTDTRATLSRVRRQLVAERKLFERQAIEAYMGGGDAEAVSGAMLSTGSANLFRTTLDYADAVLADRRTTIRRIETLEVEAKDLRDQVEQRVEASRARTVEATDVEAQLTELLEAQRDLIEEHGLLLNDSAEQVAEIRSRKSEFAAELGAADGASKDIEQILVEAQLVTGQVTSFDGEFIPPVNPLDIGSFFGPRLHPILGYVRNHDGVDLDGPSGGAIYAAADGTVVVAGTQGGYGNTVVLDHGAGLGTLYAHQSALAVRVGDRVTKGEVIGYIGSTGLSTGPHLHWEVRINGVPVDPMPYLSRLVS